jgi:hypothetical protein
VDLVTGKITLVMYIIWTKRRVPLTPGLEPRFLNYQGRIDQSIFAIEELVILICLLLCLHKYLLHQFQILLIQDYTIGLGILYLDILLLFFR